MPLITWSQSLSVGVKEIDDQHKVLVALVNEMHDAMKAGHAKEKVGEVLVKLLDYTRYHFGTEEKYFKEYHYPKSVQHTQEHEALRKKAAELQTKFEANQLSLSIELTNFLKDWLTHHITENDVAFGKFLQEKGMK